MMRTQVMIDDEVRKRARRKAELLGISLAEYLRGLIARDLGGPAPQIDASVVFNLGSSGGSDVARDKDAMVGQAVAARRRRRG